MEALPRISIVTVNYNGAAFLERTIQSVLGQNYPNLEYIIIDGGSTDNSISIIKKYEASLSYWISEPDHGMYDALQKGLKRCTGTIMAWLNSDDLYHPGAFHRIASLFNDFPQIQWLTGVPTTLDENDMVMIPEFQDYPSWSRFRYYCFDFKWIQQESTFWRKELWTKAGGSLNTNLKLAGDLELWLRFFRHEKLYVAPFLIGGFRVRRAGQKSIENMAAYLKEARRCIRHEVFGLSVFRYPLILLSPIDRLLISIPYLKKIYYYSRLRERLLAYPKQLRFNPKIQKLELS